MAYRVYRFSRSKLLFAGLMTVAFAGVRLAFSLILFSHPNLMRAFCSGEVMFGVRYLSSSLHKNRKLKI